MNRTVFNMAVLLTSMRNLPEDCVEQGNSGSKPDYTIYWSGLTYQVHRETVDKLIGKLKGEIPAPPETRTILDSISGSFSSGQMTALMGPSGAGKTTLLECLIGKRVRGLSGSIKVTKSSSLSSINIAIVPQSSDFFDYLTVFETINYSSRLKNSSTIDFDHDKQVNRILLRLDLERVKSSTVSTLSGSERKRLSIAIEIVSKPNLLVLDEPTTGLDSFAAQRVSTTLMLPSERERVRRIMTNTV